MGKFIYFNPRLTEKLNAIYKFPITIVSGRSGIGKSFSVQTYLQSGKAEVIWHASKAADFQRFLHEFQRNCEVADSAIQPVGQERGSDMLDPAGAAVEYAVAIKRSGLHNRLVYVLEYQDGHIPEAILEFFDVLSNQRIHSFNIILIARQVLSQEVMERMSTSINLIPEASFLLNAGEIKQAFSRNGIAIGDAEAGYLYLRSAGWMPEMIELHNIMLEKGKAALYEAPDCDDFWCETSEEWERRFQIEANLWTLPEFDAVRSLVEMMELEEAFIAVERVRMKAGRYSGIWDVCDYYNAVLKALNGDAKAALEDLKRGLELRIQRNLYQSAFRINLAQMQLLILLGDRWFSDERELLLSFAYRRVFENTGISNKSAGMALWRAQEYGKIIAFFAEDDGEDESDAGYMPFLVASAYREMGFVEKAVEELANGYAAAATGKTCLSAILLYEATLMTGRKQKGRGNLNRANLPAYFDAKLSAYRSAMRRNSAGFSKNPRQTLTARESEIVECVGKKMTNKEVASYLNISENTVKTTLKRIYRKLDVSRRGELQ